MIAEGKGYKIFRKDDNNFLVSIRGNTFVFEADGFVIPAVSPGYALFLSRKEARRSLKMWKERGDKFKDLVIRRVEFKNAEDPAPVYVRRAGAAVTMTTCETFKVLNQRV
jgi:hypothetical protein